MEKDYPIGKRDSDSNQLKREPLITRVTTFSVPSDGDFILDIVCRLSDRAKQAMQGEHYWDYLRR